MSETSVRSQVKKRSHRNTGPLFLATSCGFMVIRGTRRGSKTSSNPWHSNSRNHSKDVFAPVSAQKSSAHH
uniref:Uncharacterized protein n=1 Tax=Arundo donax TaxID=35708 RepID=A0A0A8YQM4_ARUDO